MYVTLFSLSLPFFGEMLTSVLRALVKNPIKESFYRKREKKKGEKPLLVPTFSGDFHFSP